MADHGKSTFGLDANLVALLCYIGNFVCYMGLILSIITVIQEKSNKLARFHAWQSIFLSVVAILLVPVYLVIGLIVGILGSAAGSGVASILGLLAFLVIGAIGLAIFVLMIMAAIKGFGGESYKIPVIGNFAEKYV